MSVKFQGEDIAGLLGIDVIPVSGSSNAVSSGGVYNALASKQNTLTEGSITNELIATGAITADKLAGGAVFVVGTNAPANTNLLWIDPTKGLKYYNGSSWVTVPVAYKE